MKCWEEDRLQCQAVGTNKKRCSRIGTHSNGGKVLCETHHQIATRKPVCKEKKK
jgi:hypothetical protein